MSPMLGDVFGADGLDDVVAGVVDGAGCVDDAGPLGVPDDAPVVLGSVTGLFELPQPAIARVRINADIPRTHLGDLPIAARPTGARRV
jgi:hypothetical protein